MSNINDYSNQSELAQAAYGTFLDGLIPIGSLIGDDVEMPASQASTFVNKWQVVTQYSDPITGVSATVFQAKDSGTKYLAIRGTELAVNDLTADGFFGISNAIKSQPPIHCT